MSYIHDPSACYCALCYSPQNQDNPHAKGLSVNEDILTEDAFVPHKDNPAFGDTMALYKKEHVLNEGEWQKAIDEKRVTLNYRQGLALTNPEE